MELNGNLVEDVSPIAGWTQLGRIWMANNPLNEASRLQLEEAVRQGVTASYYNGVLVYIDGTLADGIGEQAENINGTIFLPLRSIFEELGAHVTWNGQQRSITITTSQQHRIILHVGSNIVRIDDTELELSSPVFIRNETTMVPLRILAEALGTTVIWDQQLQGAFILTP